MLLVARFRGNDNEREDEDRASVPALDQTMRLTSPPAHPNGHRLAARGLVFTCRDALLLKQNAIAPQEYDDAEAVWKQAQATVETAAAALESANINLGYTKITAPISGRIGRSLVTVGALVTAAQTSPLATIDTLDPIYVDINQSTSELL